MTELYCIATNKGLDLEVRYAAARQMQRSRMPVKKRKRKRDYRAEYRRRKEIWGV